MSVDLDGLRKLVDAALDGEEDCDWYPPSLFRNCLPDDVAMICALSPPVVLALIERLQRAEKDAARYRWLRARSFLGGDGGPYVDWPHYTDGVYKETDYPSRDELDARIDFAIASSPPHGECNCPTDEAP